MQASSLPLLWHRAQGLRAAQVESQLVFGFREILEEKRPKGCCASVTLVIREARPIL